MCIVVDSALQSVVQIGILNSISYIAYFLGEKLDEKKKNQIKIAHILKDLGLEDDLIEKMTSLKKEEYQ